MVQKPEPHVQRFFEPNPNIGIHGDHMPSGIGPDAPFAGGGGGGSRADGFTVGEPNVEASMWADFDAIISRLDVGIAKERIALGATLKRLQTPAT